MQIFTFQHVDGTITTVRAETEKAARDLAMFHRWGEPRPLSRSGDWPFKRPYEGLGLSLLDIGAV